jgi:hypothetical protein
MLSVYENVLQIPELLQMIFGPCEDRQTLGRMARTSRYYFHSVTPKYWRDISSTALLKLLPGTETSTEGENTMVDTQPASSNYTELTTITRSFPKC